MQMCSVDYHIQRILPILETIQSSMASGTFNLPASSSLATPSKSPHGDALPPIIVHEAERVKCISQQSEGVANTAVFESELPHILLAPVADAVAEPMNDHSDSGSSSDTDAPSIGSGDESASSDVSKSPPPLHFPPAVSIGTERVYVNIPLPCLSRGSSSFVTTAWELKRAIDSGHLASIADLAWLLLHGREGLPQNKDAAFKMVEEGSRRGCPHSQGVLALCYSSDDWYPMKVDSKESFAANQRQARRLANASAEAGSKYGQFALGCIFEWEEENWMSDEATAPHNVQYSLAAAQGLDYGQLYTAMFKMHARESREEAYHLCYLAAVQGLPEAYVYLGDNCNDWDECIYWETRSLAAGHPCAKQGLNNYLERSEKAFFEEHKDLDCNSVSIKLAAEASGVMKEIVDRNLKLFSDRALTQQSHYDATDRQLAACKFFCLASKLQRAIDSGHLASIADLAWLLLHGREGLPQNKDAAFKMAQEGSRRGCPHSQGVLALCVFRGFSSSSSASSAANERSARRLANASAEAGSKYGQFALGCILWNETPQSYSAATPYGAQFALAAAQGLDEAQYDWSMMLSMEGEEDKDEAAGSEGEEDKDEKVRGLLLLAAAQGCYNAYSPLGDISLDDNEANYWCEREDSVQNASLYSAGPPPRSATLTTLVSAKARLNDVVAAAAANQRQIEQRLDATGTIVAAIRQQMEVLNAFVAANQQQMEQRLDAVVAASQQQMEQRLDATGTIVAAIRQQMEQRLNAVVAASQQQMEQRLDAVVTASQVLPAEMEQLHSDEQRQLGGSVSQLAGT